MKAPPQNPSHHSTPCYGRKVLDRPLVLGAPPVPHLTNGSFSISVSVKQHQHRYYRSFRSLFSTKFVVNIHLLSPYLSSTGYVYLRRSLFRDIFIRSSVLEEILFSLLFRPPFPLRSGSRYDTDPRNVYKGREIIFQELTCSFNTAWLIYLVSISSICIFTSVSLLTCMFSGFFFRQCQSRSTPPLPIDKNRTEKVWQLSYFLCQF